MADESVSKASDEELARLKAENEALKAKAEKLSKREKRGGFWRRFTVWLLVILAVVFSVLGVFSVWLKTTTLDTNTFVATVAPLIHNQEVAKAVSDTAVAKLFAQYDVQAQIESGLNQVSEAVRQAAPNLPQPNIDLSAIAAPITSGLKTAASTVAQKILTSDAFYKVWSEALRVAHTAAVNILTGNTNKVLTSQGDTVVLNLAPLLDQVKTKLTEKGLSFLNKVQVPPDFGQIKLFTSKQLGVAKGLVHLLEVLSWVFPLLAFLFFVAAVLLTKEKRKVLMWEGIGLAIAMLVVMVVFRVAHNELLGLVKKQQNLAAADVIWTGILAGLRSAVFGLFALGIVVAVGAAVAGPAKWAVWTREHVGDFFTHWRERREGKKGKTPFMEFMDKYAWWFRMGGLVVAVLVLVWIPHISGLAVILTVAILLVYLAVIELLR
jgi:cell division protein FtsL